MARLGTVVVTVSVAGVPELTEFGVMEHCGANGSDGKTEQVSATELLKPLTAPTVSVDVADCPALTVAGETAEAEIEKSGAS